MKNVELFAVIRLMDIRPDVGHIRQTLATKTNAMAVTVDCQLLMEFTWNRMASHICAVRENVIHNHELPNRLAKQPVGPQLANNVRR